MTPSRPPDVAFLPQPGVLRAYAREHLLVPLDAGVLGAVDENYDPLWRRLGSVGRRLYGVWFKAANKSLIWYNEGVFERSGVTAGLVASLALAVAVVVAYVRLAGLL